MSKKENVIDFLIKMRKENEGKAIVMIFDNL